MREQRNYQLSISIVSSCFWASTIIVSLVVSFIMTETVAAATTTTDPSNIHAVLVSSSRYWHNYRHANNAFAMYKRLRDNGVPESNIVLMVGDEIPANARNPFKNQMFVDGIDTPSVYDETVSITYRGSDVTVPNFMNALLGTIDASAPRRMLHTNQDSHILVYVTGHGGDNFFKFQDVEELTSQDIANVFAEMHRRKLYKQILFIADTCQAFTLADKLEAPEVYALGTSLKDQNAYAHHSDKDVGLSVIERWTYRMLQHYAEFATPSSTLKEIMVDPLQGKLGAEIGVRDNLGSRPFNKVLMEEFFGQKDVGRASPSPSRSSRPKDIVALLARALQSQQRKAHVAAKQVSMETAAPPAYHPPDNFYQIVLLMLGTAFLLGKLSRRKQAR
jgi:GPI-anchor transamidase subunit K